MRDGAGVCRPKCLEPTPALTNTSLITNEKGYYTGSALTYKTILGIRDPGTPTQCEHKCDIGYKPSLDRKSCELVLCPVDTYYCPATDSNPANTVRDCIAKGAICGDGGRRASGNYCNDTDAVCDIHEGPGCADCDGVV